MNATRSNHQTRINSTPNNTTKRIPGPFIEPIQKLIESTLHHIRCRTIVEPNGNDCKNDKTKYRWVWAYDRIGDWTQMGYFDCFFITYQGSNSWMILSNRMTANNRDANPDIHASIRTANVIKLLQPAALRLITVLFEFAMARK